MQCIALILQAHPRRSSRHQKLQGKRCAPLSTPKNTNFLSCFGRFSFLWLFPFLGVVWYFAEDLGFRLMYLMMDISIVDVFYRPVCIAPSLGVRSSSH